MTDAPSRVERVLNLLALMLDTRIARTREEYVREIAGYPTQTEANRRAFERDKEILRGMGVPITMETIGDSNEVGYRVRPDDYCLPDLGLSSDETAALRVAVSAISLGDGSGQGALMKLGGVGDQASAPIASLPIAPALATLFDAFRRRAVVTFPYRTETRTVEPWGLSSKRGHWYVVGFDRDRNAVRAFRADRIDGDVEVGESGAFDVPDDFRPDDHIEDRGWLLGDAPTVNVRLAVDADHLDGVLGELGADARVEKGADGRTFVDVSVSNQAAFRSFVLGFLDHAEIVDPPAVRAAMIEWLETVAAGAS
ncbi:MAG: proteasome accessory factor [Actinomycetota bacterium]|nr:proteasome accessory factor [Actinomycetota bacterium]